MQALEAVGQLLETDMDDAVVEQAAAEFGVDYEGALNEAIKGALDCDSDLGGLGRLLGRAGANDGMKSKVKAMLERFVANPHISLDHRLQVADIAAKVRLM